MTLLATLGRPVITTSSRVLLDALDDTLASGGPNEAWLAFAVITGSLPSASDVSRVVRATRLDGPVPALSAALRDSGQLGSPTWPEVEVVTGRTLVDVRDTARNPFTTGIQRVVRQTARRWQRDHEVILVGWTHGFAAYRRLSDAECDSAINGPSRTVLPEPAPDHPVLVPWDCRLLVPELPAERERASRYQALACFSRSTTGFVGHDCVPLTASETTDPDAGMSAGFAHFLAAAAHADRIATTCKPAELEYRGWRAMLAGAGLSGPDIQTVPLPVQATNPSEDALAEARLLFGIGTLPLVLSVGSHEPRKNHLALLHSAEVLWREGLAFNLVLVGGLSWNSAAFNAQVDSLRRANRPVQTLMGLPDDLLWAAYRLAHCTVFASLHEGFGLPVAESLASGTPVITSDFGSMRDLASHGGALLVDPRRDQSLTDALRRLLSDRPLRDRLAAETSQLPRRTWDDYAAELWDFLVNATRPEPIR
jgi:glycosyltransferase involved in cell wall biosynthesis